jgi:L-lactate dehydrogenase complex protein LldG
MSDSRTHILASIRRSLGRGESAPPSPPPRAPNLRPQRACGDRAALTARFVEMAQFAGAGVARVASAAEVPAAIAAFVARNGLGDELVLAPDDALSALPWHDAPRLIVHRRPPTADDRVSVTGAVSGEAETGTLLVRSAPSLANALHLLPDAHVVVLDARAIVGGYEDGWAHLAGGAEGLPRAATIITGPSRTADIEKTPQIGVHGPRRLHIVLIDDQAAP